MERKTLLCQTSILNAEINLPASKSISNRLLIIKSLSGTKFSISNISDAHDSVLMSNLLSLIENNNPENELLIDTQDAGTVFRFLTALLSIQKGIFVLTGNARMQQRPIGILVNALRKLGADIKYLNKDGYPPLKIAGKKLLSKNLEIDSSISSQYISALLLISPTLPEGLQISFKQKPVSYPYIKMTLELMREYGINFHLDAFSIEVKNGHYIPKDAKVEADWSAAAFFYQSLAFAKGGKILLKGLSTNSIQGDAWLAEIFTQLGIHTTEKEYAVLIEKKGDINHQVNLDFSQHPDLALPIIATCAGLGVIGKFTGLHSLKIKESNRVEVLEKEFAKLGFDFRETDENEWVLINSCKTDKKEFDFSKVFISTYHDHRVAMSIAPFAILGKSIQIENPDVVKKSFPDFWDEYIKLGIIGIIDKEE